MFDYKFTLLQSAISDFEWNIQVRMDTNKFRDENLEASISYLNRKLECHNIQDNLKFDCLPQGNSTQKKCLARGCCWEKTKFDDARKDVILGVPNCFYPSNYPGYSMNHFKKTPKGFTADLDRRMPSPYPNDIMHLKLDIFYETKNRLHIKIYDPHKARFEVPLVTPSCERAFKDPDYSIGLRYEPFSLQVRRSDASKGAVLFDSKVGAFIFADQFLQLSTLLPSRFIYGLGEHRGPLMHSVNWTRFTMWNKDQPPVENTNLYGSHPFYIVMEEDGNSHGVFMLNSNAMDVLLQPTPALTWRTIGGIIDMYIFTGPSPADVISQYTEVIGRPFMPPYWSLGFHICKFGYTSVNETFDVVRRTHAAGIPQDVQWDDMDYAIDNLDFTYDRAKFGDVPGLAKQLHAKGMHYMMNFDCGISDSQPRGGYLPYDLGLKWGIFINDSQGVKPLEGKVWPGTTVWPDFSNPNTQNYWTLLVKDFHKKVGFDGMWIDMDEPSNFITGSTHSCPKNSSIENPPYVPAVHGGVLRYFTICPSAKQYLSLHYDLHNMYGMMETKASYNALLASHGKRPFVISRSTFPGQGKYGGHWTGDNFARYHDMAMSIPAILNFNLFGIPMVGADICGFNLNTTEQLCQRWHQLGAFYPFSRNHNAKFMKPQDPAVFGPALIASTAQAYHYRYSLLPYLYTLFHRSHTLGETVARPMFLEFPKDPATYSVDQQFLWGPALLIAPVLEENVTMIQVYFPVGTWFDFTTGETIQSVGEWLLRHTPMDKINLLVRGGFILPCQTPGLTTTESGKKPFCLVVALSIPDGDAKGELYWDDGESVDTFEKNRYNSVQFHAHNQTLYSVIQHSSYADESKLGNITMYGFSRKPVSVSVNGKMHPFQYDQYQRVLNLTNLELPMFKFFIIKWIFPVHS